jgi:hypothetical protein
MTTTDSVPRRPGRWKQLLSGDMLFGFAVIGAYFVATVLAIHWRGFYPDRMMMVAERALGGHLDSAALKGTIDSVDIGGRYYLAIGPLQLAAYIPFAAVPDLRLVGGYLTGLLFGVPAALLALPMARAYGARGASAYWIASFGTFGTLLFWSSVFGNFYYLAHAESFLLLTLFLIEWAGRRRHALLGLSLGLSFLARPPTLLAAVPFGLLMLWAGRGRIRSAARTAVSFGLPIAAAVGIYGWFNWVRFGTPLESGYGISLMLIPGLAERRAQGLFSVVQIPENVRLAFLQLPDRVSQFPFFSANPHGMSMALVSPALVTSLWAGFREETARLLWISVGLVAIPVFMYYGGGIVQYGFRYSLDFTPFLVALMAIGSRRWFGWPEKLLVFASIGSVALGLSWYGATG